VVQARNLRMMMMMMMIIIIIITQLFSLIFSLIFTPQKITIIIN